MNINEIKKSRILIYGAGAIGSIFGGKLAISDMDITVLARGIRFEEIKKDGIILREALSGKEDKVKVKVINSLKEEDIYDYILVVVQKTQIDSILPILRKNKSPNIVFVVNNPCGYQDYIDSVGYDRVMIGFPAAGGERKEGVVSYIVWRGLFKVFQSTTFGEVDGRKTERLRKLIDIFKVAGFSPSRSNNMDQWQKTHVAVVVSIGKALYKFNSNNYELAKSPKALKAMVLSIRESFKVLKKTGAKITPTKMNVFYLPCFILVPILSVIMNSKIAEFIMAKHTIVAKEEMNMLEKDLMKIVVEAGEDINYFNS